MDEPRISPEAAARHSVPRPFAPLLIVLCLFFGMSALWTFVVPVHDSQGIPSSFHPDEPNHIAVISYIARNGTLPPYTFAYYESAHPPLYHLAAAGIYCFFEPRIGSDDTIRLLRLVGGILGTAIVWLVWRTAHPLIGTSGALFAAALAGSVPMFLSLSASVTNELLAALAGAGAVAGLTAGVRRRAFDRRTLLTVALWTAVGTGTKVTCLGLLPVSLGVVGLVGYCHGVSLRRVAVQLSAIVLIAAALSGWWYARNLVLYGDPLRRTEATAMWKERIPGYAALSSQGKATAPAYAARVTFWGWASFWGLFDAFSHPLPAWVYVCLGGFQGTSLVGLVRSLRRTGIRDNPLWPLIAASAPFAAAVAIVYYRYTWDHYTPQGRFFFPLLLPFSIMTAGGWLFLWRAGRIREGNFDTALAAKTVLPVLVLFVLLNGFILAKTFLEHRAGLPVCNPLLLRNPIL